MKYLIILLLASCSTVSHTDQIAKMAIKKVTPKLSKCVAAHKSALNDSELITNLHFTMGRDGKPKDILILNEENKLIENDELRICQASVIKSIKYTKGFSREEYVVQPIRYRLK